MSKRLAVLEKVIAAGQGDSFAWYGLAMEYRTLGRFEDALRTFTTLRQNDPDYVPQYLMAGQLLSEQGQPEQAREWIQQGIERARAKGDGHALSELESLLAQVSR